MERIIKKITKYYDVANKVTTTYSVQPATINTKRNFKSYVDEDGFSYRMNLQNGEVVERKRKDVENCIRRSARRSENIIRDIIKCNDFIWFGTLTFDKDKVDRLDDVAVKRAFDNFRKWCRRNIPSMYYLTVLERHEKDNAIHFHILIGGCTEEELKLADSGKVVCHWAKKGYISGEKFEKQKAKHTLKDTDGDTIFNIGAFKFGWSTVTKIQNKDAVENYILKYIRKDFCDSEMFKKRYYVSKNVQRVKVVREAYWNVELYSLNFDIRKFAFNELEYWGISKDVFLQECYHSSEKQIIIFDYLDKGNYISKRRSNAFNRGYACWQKTVPYDYGSNRRLCV